jgi:hypothetical protein
MIELVSGLQHLNSETNLRDCKGQSWFKDQTVPVFRFDVFAYPRLKIIALAKNLGASLKLKLCATTVT